jgi:glycosyltransferase involved in cell wall biosynthesis
VPSRKRILINAISLTQQGGGRSYVRNLLRELNADDRGFDFAILAAPEGLTTDEAGLYFEQDDAAGLAARVDEMLAETEATARRVELGRECAAAFTWEASTNQLCAVFNRALDRTQT